MVYYLFTYMSSFSVDVDTSKGTKTSLSIFSQTAVTFGTDVFILAEAKGGMDFSKIGDDVNNYSLAISYGMIVFNILIFGFLAFYLD